jgi:indolepyruvate ferredoxin oxidoreductase beta subunit
LIPKKSADIIIGFEPSETVRVIDYLKDDGVVVVNDQGMQSVLAALTGEEYDTGIALDFLRSQLTELVVCDGWRLCREAHSPKVLNVALVGAAAATGALDMSIAELSETIRAIAPARFIDLNLKALEIGAGGVHS